MGRVINNNTPAKSRNRCRRAIAEILRHLSQKPALDEETKDMAAMIVFLLREIDSGVEQTISAWEKRGYWMKAERFLRDWEWTREAAANFEDIIRNEAWELLPELLADLFPRFADIQVKKMTYDRSEWEGAYEKLLEAPQAPLPW